MYDHRKTTALLVAGRALDAFFPTVGQLMALRQLAEPRGLAVVVAGDETYAGAPREPEDPLHARLVIGAPFLGVTADEVPLGPIEPSLVGDAVQRVAELGALWWRGVARALGPSSTFSPAERRASLPERLRQAFEGVGFDGPDLAAAADRVHLVASGPLASAMLARGKLGALPLDEDGMLDLEAADRWVYGQRSNQDAPEMGVEGQQIARVDALDLGTQAIPEAVFREGAVYLIARYD